MELKSYMMPPFLNENMEIPLTFEVRLEQDKKIDKEATMEVS